MTPIDDALIERARASPQGYLEFLRVPTMSLGLYVLPAGGEDTQHPHSEDEVYYVLRGRGTFRSAGTDAPTRAGDVLFVPAHRPHRFHGIEEELVLLVVFAPPEGSQR
ncbi:MAG TPA: cupin domain-containing protein [Thermoplasmata archaeon]|nr:cupin domain-containing protein [Thermoplasmata archaeon]